MTKWLDEFVTTMKNNANKVVANPALLDGASIEEATLASSPVVPVVAAPAPVSAADVAGTATASPSSSGWLGALDRFLFVYHFPIFSYIMHTKLSRKNIAANTRTPKIFLTTIGPLNG